MNSLRLLSISQHSTDFLTDLPPPLPARCLIDGKPVSDATFMKALETSSHLDEADANAMATIAQRAKSTFTIACYGPQAPTVSSEISNFIYPMRGSMLHNSSDEWSLRSSDTFATLSSSQD
jgi:hypothetical protein